MKLRKKNDGRVYKGWFVTLEEPTADQRTVAKDIAAKKNVQLTALSYDSFRSRLIDATAYLSARSAYPFGSVRDPETGESRDSTAYIKLGLYEMRKSCEASVDDLVQILATASSEIAALLCGS